MYMASVGLVPSLFLAINLGDLAVIDALRHL